MHELDLFEACVKGNTEDVKHLISSGESLTFKTVLGSATLMSVAAWFGHVDMVQILIEKYPYMVEKQIEKTGMTPMMLAKLNKHLKVVDLLEKHVKKNKLKLKMNFLTIPSENNDVRNTDYPLTPNCAFSSNPFMFNEEKPTDRRRSKSESRPLKRSEIDNKLISVLKSSNLAECIPIFKEQEIDLKTFLTLERVDIISMGITESSTVANLSTTIAYCIMDPQRPFYRPPSCLLKTSAEIISEARAEMSTKPVNTKRPFTPRERQRTLFGSLKAGTSRPPSSISLRQVQFQDIDNTVKLPPLRNTNSLFKVPNRLPPWRLPDLPRASSLTNLPEEVEEPRDISWTDILRETHSSPQERTDFSEKKPRNLSALSSWYQRKNLRRKSKCYTKNDSIKESDENEDVQTLTINHPNTNYFKIPSVQPLMKSDIEENIINEIKEEKPTTIMDIINKINENKDNDIMPLLIELYPKVQNEMKNKGNHKIQSLILKTLYKFVENANDSLLLQISKIILALKVKGPNLSSVTKLIFKVSRSDKNDSLFLQGDLLEIFVESLGRASPIDDAEACIYGYGALKFLTMNQQLLLVALKLGILELMVLHLKIVNSARLELLTIPEQTSHAMFQLTGTLRNVASEDITLNHFVNTGAIGQLCTSMELFSADLDLISNIARTMSILSQHNECCDSIIQYENSFRSIIKIFNKYPGRQDIIVRFGYALGNIIAKSESARTKLYKEPGAMKSILSILETYLDKDLEQMKTTGINISKNNPEWASDGSIEDVIVKMIRIVANMSMNYEVGVGMTCVSYIYDETNHEMGSMDQIKANEGGRFLDILLMVLRRKSVSESEELVMSTLSTLNNLSYYAEPDAGTEGPFALRQIEITQVLSTLLLTKNEESMIEVTRVLGNLTRSKEIRDYILEIGGVSQLVRCLEHDNKELLFTTTGVLVNLMADWDKRLAFKEANGVQRLIVVLKQTCDGDWRLASLVCQALWNFCIDSTHLYAALGIQATNSLLAVLVDLLDEEKLFGISEGSEIPEKIYESHEYRLWEQFANVATNLLEKIEQYLENLHAFDEK